MGVGFKRRYYKQFNESLGLKRNGASKWMVLLVAENCDMSTEMNAIEHELAEIFGSEVEFFIPVYSESVKGKRVSRVFLDRYVFVKKTDTVTEELFQNRTEHLEGVLETQGRYVTDNEILRIQSAMYREVHKNIPKKGQSVIPLEGTFKNLEGRVLSVNRSRMTAMVVFERSSRTVEAPISIINLELIRRE
jgi:transcription antitermination factor NusG